MSSTFSPSQQEITVVAQVFAYADPNKLGVITGDAAIKIFAGTNLSPIVLGEIWDIADEGGKGWLSKKGVAVAVRLIGWAQKGEKISLDLLNKPGPLPNIEGITNLTKQHTGISLPRSPPPSGLPPLKPEDKVKFQRLFASCKPVNGLVSGERARDVFVKSKLSLEQLSQIWNLADTQDRGSLDATDFTIGMYLIQAAMSGQLPVIPSSLPSGLYEQAGGVSLANNILVHNTGTSGSFSPITSVFPSQRTSLPSQYTGQSQTAATSPRFQSRTIPTSLGTSAFSSLSTWDVTAREKAASDKFFDELDTFKKGYIEGDAAVPFMLESKLPGDDLARIWDLADISSDGRLTKDTFAVAMHLIFAKSAGKEIPAALPPSLIPPSLRANGVVPSSPQRSEPQVDLFTWDDTPPVSATLPVASAIPKQPTGRLPFATSFSKTSAFKDPFAASSSIPNLQKSLLDDDESHTHAPPLQDQSAEIGNAKNQLASTNRSLETTRTERTSVEQTLSSQAAQLSALQTQLSSAKAAYETETKLLASLRERWANQNADIQKAREELITAESDLSAVRVEKAEVEGSFLRDKEEARELHRKMFEVAQQAEATKPEVDKMKKEAKQQKGLLAIARKQLNVKEAEHAKIMKELEEAKAEHQSIVSEREATEAELEKLSLAPPLPKTSELPHSDSADTLAVAAAQVLPSTPTPSSSSNLAAGQGKSNNPFERLAMVSGKSTPDPQSPFQPFTNLSGPGGPAETEADITTSDDPFGFDQAFSVDRPVTNVPKLQQNGSDAPSGTSSSTPKPAKAISLPPVMSSASDTSDNEYSTPPTTSRGLASATSPVENAAKMFPDLDDSASHFPALQQEGPTHSFSSEGPKDRDDDEPAFDPRQMELNAHDSDSESDEDEVPLGELTKGKGTGDRTRKVEGADGNAKAAPGPSFDDIFAEPPPSIQGDSAVKDAFGVPSASNPPFNRPPTTDDTAVKTTVSSPGANAFDEAMGKISGNGAASAAPKPKLTFDTAFDTGFEDNFDFTAATSIAQVNNSPPPQAAVDVKATTNTSPAPRNEGFDDIFGIPLATSAVAPTLPALDVSAPLSLFTSNGFAQSPVALRSGSPTANAVSSEDPASGFQPPKPSEVAVSASVVFDDTLNAKPAGSQPTSPESSPETSRISHNRPVSPPPQQKSSPPRVASPRTRPSTSSSKEAHEKPKDPPPRHSKLSIRLPFGRKKNKQHQESVPPPVPLAQQDQLSGADPALVDDVDAVKQLCGMGFSRADAVTALEQNGYHFNRALNSLLGPDARSP